MNANDVIESYVSDVAVQLPRKQRSDVAFELRALLDEGLQARAAAVGRDADAAMATEFVRAFGRPGDVAARYRPTLTIIDPADGHAFLRATVVGLAILWCTGLLMGLRQPVASVSDFLTALGRQWAATLIFSLWWPGLLVVSFGAASWVRRRWPQTSEWKPRAGDRIHGNRAALVMGLVGTVGGLFVLSDPRWLLDALLGGRAAPAAYDALTYTETFRHRQGPWLFALLLLNVPMLINGIATGRWWPIMRRIRSWQSLVTCAVLVWTVLDGPVFIAPSSDRMVKFALVLIVASTLIGMGVTLRRSVRPTPDRRIQA
jgi:hypothetical protein